MRDELGKIIYIGKAKNLRNRVRSYFIKNQNYKTQKLVERIAGIEFVLTDNESEAFLLESNMIKQYRPAFNIELKDQQRYTYLRLTDEEFPRLVVARRTRAGKFLGGGDVFGPFTHGSSKMLTVGLLRKTFKIRICKRLPKKACLEYHLGNCEAPCEFKDAQSRYEEHVLDLKAVLRGKDLQDYVKKLESQMREASETLQFERAKDIRDTLKRLGNLSMQQKMESVRGHDEEYFGIRIDEHTATIMNFKKIGGVIRDSNRFSFDLVGDNSFMNFLFQYYTTNQIPPNIIVNRLPENVGFLEKMLTDRAGFMVKIRLPGIGKEKDMINLILKNVDLVYTKGANPALVDLRDMLRLPKIPNVIECFDISNHGSDYAVGAMSRFVDGEPHRAGYRRFKIKTVRGQDDFAMINEVIKRRYMRLDDEKSPMPDLVLVDGGKGQLGAAISALSSLGIHIPCVSLAKENEDVFTEGAMDPLVIPRKSRSLKILQFARDEAHRFGVTYNRALRTARMKLG